MEKHEKLDLVLQVYNATLYSELESVKFEDIPKKIEDILTRVLKRKVTIHGNGLTENIIAEIDNEGHN